MAASSTHVPFLDLRAAYAELQSNIDAAVARVISSGSYLLGEEVIAFEREFASYVDAKHCISVGNGLDALQLTLRAYGVGPGHEVIVPGNTFIATWLAVTQVGARPVAVDPDDRDFTITAAAVERAITSRTRAVIPVHLYGQPADMEPLVTLA